MLSKHYCGEELAVVAVGHQKIDCCDDPATMPGGCCHDEQEMVQVDEEYEANTLQFQAATLFASYHLPFLDLSALFLSADERITYADYYIDPPPLVQDIPILKQSFQL
ncbi:MAG: hypothetical protein RIG62_20405 [Cyclobacteriaceae bacterium]